MVGMRDRNYPVPLPSKDEGSTTSVTCFSDREKREWPRLFSCMPSADCFMAGYLTEISVSEVDIKQPFQNGHMAGRSCRCEEC